MSVSEMRTTLSTASVSRWNDNRDRRRLLPLLLIALTLPAQIPTLDKPPQDIDDALRARIRQFYDYHVARKYRQCEPLIAEESKDDFYVITKPQLESYKIGNIEYSDHFTRAKAVIVGMTPVLLAMAPSRIMEQPFASFWRIEKGIWLWYYSKADAPDTPLGKAKPDSRAPGEAGSVSQPPDVTIRQLQSALKIDRTRIDLAGGRPQTVKVTNTLPGPASLTIDCPLRPIAQTGVTATFDKKDLQGNETAILTLTADPDKYSGPLPLQIMVRPTNQVLNLTITVSR